MTAGWRRIFAAAACAWLAALFLAVIVAALPRVGAFLYSVSALIYYVGSIVCHQRPERSFHFSGAQFPVCARCAGIYAGGACAALAAAVRFARHANLSSRSAVATLAIGAAPSMATLVYEFASGHVPANWTRAAAGVPLGVAAAWIISAGTSRTPLGVH